MAVIAADIPLHGMVKDLPGKRLGPGQSPELLNTWAEAGELRARPGLNQVGDIPNTIPVQQIISAEFADGTKETVRIDGTKTYFYDGVAWTEITGTAFTGGNLVPFGWTMSLNRLVISNGILADGIWEWDGSAGARTKLTGGVLATNAACRYLATFSNRVIGGYTTDTGGSGAITVIGSAVGSTTDWTLASGAFSAIRNEHPSVITNLTADDNTLIVWKERAIVTGVETGDSSAPIFWQLLRTEGIGNIAPFSVASYGGFYFALSHEGFYTLAGGQPQFIDDAIRRDFFSRLNYNGLRQIRAVVIPEFGKIAWLVPETNETYATHAWVYDIVNQGWERQRYSLGMTAIGRAFLTIGDAKVNTFNVNPDHLVDGGLLSGAIVDSFGTATAQPVYAFGDEAGKTYFLDFTKNTDAGAPFEFVWETPDLTWEGLEDTQTGRVVGPLDVVTFDRAELEYRHSGSNSTLDVSISTDGGATFTPLETKTLMATTGGYVRLSIFGRVSGKQIRLRFSIGAVVGFPKFRNLTVYGYPTGEIR